MKRIEQKIAQEFAKEMSRLGYSLDFTIESLNSSVDNIIRSNLIINSEEGKCNQAKLEAYIGETLARRFSGEWTGQFNVNFRPCKYFCVSAQF